MHSWISIQRSTGPTSRMKYVFFGLYLRYGRSCWSRNHSFKEMSFPNLWEELVRWTPFAHFCHQMNDSWLFMEPAVLVRLVFSLRLAKRLLLMRDGKYCGRMSLAWR